MALFILAISSNIYFIQLLYSNIVISFKIMSLGNGALGEEG